MDLIRICGIGIVTLTMLTVAKQVRQDLCFTIRGIAVIIFTGIIISLSIPVYEFIKELCEELPASFGYCEIMLKALGIVLAVRICSDLCRDMGEPSIGGYIEIAGKIQLIILIIPIVKNILDSVREIVL